MAEDQYYTDQRIELIRHSLTQIQIGARALDAYLDMHHPPRKVLEEIAKNIRDAARELDENVKK